MRSELKNTERVINEFGKTVKFETQDNLRSVKFGGPQKVSGRLYKSIDYDLTSNQHGFVLDFIMEQYGEYRDLGVSGTKVKRIAPFGFRSPPRKLSRGAFDRSLRTWINKKRIRLRDKITGKFLKDKGQKSLIYLFKKSIIEKGIPAGLFFTTPFKKHFKRFPDDLAEALAMDIENLF